MALCHASQNGTPKVTDTIITYNGLLKQRPTSPAPRVGEQRYFSWQERTGKSGKPYTHVKNEQAEYGGQLCEIISAEQTDFKDAHGNVSFNVEFSPLKPDELLDARQHIMQAANLYVMCLDCVNNFIGAHIETFGNGSLLTAEMFQAAVGTLFIEASRAGYVSRMPTTPNARQRE
jgi:hypothetical protein